MPEFKCESCSKVFHNPHTFRSHKNRNKNGLCANRIQRKAIQQLPYEIIKKAVNNLNACEFIANESVSNTDQIKQGEEQETTNALLKTLSDQICELTKKNEELSKTASTNKEYVTKYKRLESKHNTLLKQIKKQKVTIVRPGMTQPRRLEIAASQEWKCNKCSKILSSVFEIDHIIRWVDSYDDSNENLQALCMECHKIKTAEENTN